MPSLIEQIHALTETVLSGQHDLDQALNALDYWFVDHAATLSGLERQAFSASLDTESTQDDRSLIDSVLRLHLTRLLYRYDRDRAPSSTEDGCQSAYALARGAFARALQDSEDSVNEARIDIAIANAHHLMGDSSANRRWLDTALDRLPPLVSTDLVTLAQDIPAMPLPKTGLFARAGLKLVGLNFERLAQENRDNFAAIARMQTDQLVILAHLIGTSFETIRERQRAKRAFRLAAHLIVRYNGMRLKDTEHLLSIAESIQRHEPEAARALAAQARDLCDQTPDEEALSRAEAILSSD